MRTLILAFLLVACAPPPPPSKMSSSMTSADQTASCPKDTSVVGGGFEIPAAARVAGKVPIIVASKPTESGWLVQCVEADGSPSSACKAYVLCATIQ